MIKEYWKPIKGYEDLYMVSNWGRVKSFDRWVKSKNGSIRICRGRILKPYTNKDGYLYVVLSKNNKQKTFKVHRLVAEAFLPNPYNLLQVNHRDENKLNNNVDNLEWCTNEYNINYGTRTERMSKSKINGKRSKIVIQYNLDGTFVREWPSAMECDRNGYDQGNVSACCRGKLKTYKGYIWKYK